jgi:hypothetical protein
MRDAGLVKGQWTPGRRPSDCVRAKTDASLAALARASALGENRAPARATPRRCRRSIEMASPPHRQTSR